MYTHFTERTADTDSSSTEVECTPEALHRREQWTSCLVAHSLGSPAVTHCPAWTATVALHRHTHTLCLGTGKIIRKWLLYDLAELSTQFLFPLKVKSLHRLSSSGGRAASALCTAMNIQIATRSTHCEYSPNVFSKLSDSSNSGAFANTIRMPFDEQWNEH